MDQQSEEFFNSLKGMYPTTPKSKALNGSNKPDNLQNLPTLSITSASQRSRIVNKNKHKNGYHTNGFDGLNYFSSDYDKYNNENNNNNNNSLIPSLNDIKLFFINFDKKEFLLALKKLSLITISVTMVTLPCLLFGCLTFPLYLLASKISLDSWSWCISKQLLLFESMYRAQGTLGIVLASPLIYVWQSFSLISLMFDYIFFPGFTKCKIINPVFVVGCPRSGTTYLHRQLTKKIQINENNFIPTKRKNRNKNKKIKKYTNSNLVTHKLWEILFPSLCVRTLAKPFILLIDKVIRMFAGYELLRGAYDYQINGEPHEEALLSMHGLCGDFYVEPHAVGFFWDLQMKYIGMNKKNHWKTHCKFLRLLLKRQIYWTGNKVNSRIVCKSPSMTWCLKEILQEFNDSKIILLVRDPKDMICSNLSLLYNSWSLLFGKHTMREFWNKAKKNLIWRRHEQWKRLLDVLKSNNKINNEINNNNNSKNNSNNNKRILVIRYSDIKSSLIEVMIKCYSHCKFKSNPSQIPLINYYTQEKERQKNRKRKHENKPLAYYRIPKQPLSDAFKDVTQYFEFKTVWE